MYMEEKRIEYKATRRLLMAILFISIGITWLFVIVIALFSTTLNEDIIIVFIALLAVSILTIGIAFAVCYIKVKTYVFTKDGIEVFCGKKKICCYDIKNIREMCYVKLSLKYYGREMFDFNARKGASWCLYVFTKDEQKKVLFWFNADIAKKLQTELYGNLVTIY